MRTTAVALLWRRFVALIVILSISALPIGEAAAIAQQDVAAAPGWATGIDKIFNVGDAIAQPPAAVASAIGDALDNRKVAAAIDSIPQGDDLPALDRIAKNLSKNQNIVERADKILTVYDLASKAWKIGRHIVNGEYKQASQEAATALIGVFLDRTLGNLIGLLCTAFTVGAGAIVCFIAGNLAASYISGWASEKLGNWAGGAIYCRFRPQDPDCQEKVGTTVAETGPNPATVGPRVATGPPRPPGPEATGPDQQSSRSRRPGGARVGSTSIKVAADNITTSASGGGKASTEVGTVTSGSARTNAAVGDVVTTANGRSAKTEIAPNGGNVVVTGSIVNRGGNLTVGGNGMYSRDGRLCVDFYRNLCIVQLYPKPPKKPCMPRYLYNAMRNLCEMPSDYDHSIVQ